MSFPLEESFPSPIAIAFAEAHHEERGRDAAAAVALVSRLIRYVAAVLLSDALDEPWSAEGAQLLGALRRPVADGQWLALARHAAARIEARGDPFDDLLLSAWKDAALDRRFGDAIAHRNRVVHQGDSDAATALRRATSEIVQELGALRFHRLLVPVSTTIDDRGRRSYRATLLQGHRRPFPSVSLETDGELVCGRPHLARHGNGELLCMFPFLLADASGSALFALSQHEGRKLRVDPWTEPAELAPRSARDAAATLEALVQGVSTSKARIRPRRLDLGDAGLSGQRRLRPGDRLGRYRITGFIGSGGMADVYRARRR